MVELKACFGGDRRVVGTAGACGGAEWMIEGLTVLLEHGAAGVPNWRFGSSGADAKGSDSGGSGSGGSDSGGKRAGMWSLRGRSRAGARGDVPDSSGTPLVTKVATMSVRSEADDRPMHVAAEGSYRGVPLALEAEVPSTTVYRQPAAVPTVLRLQSGAVKLVFDGTMERPLDLDGAAGRLTLDAPVLTPIVVMVAGTRDV